MKSIAQDQQEEVEHINTDLSVMRKAWLENVPHGAWQSGIPLQEILLAAHSIRSPRPKRTFMTRMIFFFLLFMCALDGMASALCPPAAKDTKWSIACFEESGGKRRVRNIFMDRLEFDAFGKTTILIGDSPGLAVELVAVDRQGIVVVPNIRHTGDFDYPDAVQGIGRFSIFKAGAGGASVARCGYFRAPQFDILVPPEYDYCAAFREDGAYACKGCEVYCSDLDCHDTIPIGGRGVELTQDGAVRRRFLLRELNAYCRRPELMKIFTTGHGRKILSCPGDESNPFDM